MAEKPKKLSNNLGDEEAQLEVSLKAAFYEAAGINEIPKEERGMSFTEVVRTRCSEYRARKRGNMTILTSLLETHLGGENVPSYSALVNFLNSTNKIPSTLFTQEAATALGDILNPTKKVQKPASKNELAAQRAGLEAPEESFRIDGSEGISLVCKRTRFVEGCVNYSVVPSGKKFEGGEQNGVRTGELSLSSVPIFKAELNRMIVGLISNQRWVDRSDIRKGIKAIVDNLKRDQEQSKSR